MTRPNIDLTSAVDDAAREIFVAAISLQANQSSRPVVVDDARRAWDENRLEPTRKTFWRRVALAGLEGAVPAIARQAFDVGFNTQGEVSFDADGQPMMTVVNPWAEDLDDELRRL